WLFPWTSLGEAREGAREQTRSAECGIGTEPQEQAVANCRKQGTGGQALPFSSFWREVRRAHGCKSFVDSCLANSLFCWKGSVRKRLGRETCGRPSGRVGRPPTTARGTVGRPATTIVLVKFGW